MADAIDVELVLLVASPVHRYEGRPASGAVRAASSEARQSLDIRAGLGVVGDRYFNARAHRRASVTFFAAEQLDRVASELGAGIPLEAERTRRNVVTRGLDVDALRGSVLTVDSGDGPVRFRMNRPANPCAWMDAELAPGAFRALRGRGGMRAEPLDDGVLRLGRARCTVSWEDA